MSETNEDPIQPVPGVVDSEELNEAPPEDTPAPEKAAEEVADDTPVEPAPLPPTLDDVLDQLEDQVTNVPLPTLDHEKAKKWLKDFREPLAGMGTHAFIDMLQSFTQGQSDDYLRGVYEQLSPEELNEVVAANAQTINELAEGRAREAGIVKMAHERLTASMSSIIFQGLTKALLLL